MLLVHDMYEVIIHVSPLNTFIKVALIIYGHISG